MKLQVYASRVSGGPARPGSATATIPVGSGKTKQIGVVCIWRTCRKPAVREGNDLSPRRRQPGCDHDGREQQNDQERVIRRLDMTEARMVMVEAMLERLVQCYRSADIPGYHRIEWMD